jgi:hypothetical protein
MGSRLLPSDDTGVPFGQYPEEEHVVLADPDGNEFCVVTPG